MASNTLTNTKISVTYGGVLHSNGMQLPATGLEQVYDGFGNMSSIRIGRNCSGMTVCGPLSATSISTSSSLSANQINTKTLLDVLHPVGTVLFTYTPGNPNLRSGWNGTTWLPISQGRFIVGVGEGNDGTENHSFAVGASTGKYNHQLTIAEMPSHRHGFTGGDGNTDRQSASPFQLVNDDPEQTWVPGSVKNNGSTGILDTGGNARHNNVPPSFGLYIWRRTA
jgi:hypothetical protein